MTSKAHILVVEDDPLVCEVVGAALDEVYATTIVGSSGAALERLRAGGVDLMLLDCTLPDGVDGRLIPEADGGGVPVVLMSGDPGRMEKLVDQPRPFVTKPFTLTILLSTVDDVIQARHVAASA